MDKEPLQKTIVGSVPVPDPTALTTAALLREVEHVHRQLQVEIGGVRDVFRERLDGMDKAIELLQQSTDKVPTHIAEAVAQLQRLNEERFKSFDNQLGGIQLQFGERDKRTEQLSLADKTAIAAALQAQKEAAGAQNESNAAANTKMEGNFAKLIDQLSALQALDRKNLETQINDLKESRDKSRGSGDTWVVIVAGVSALAAVASAVITVVVMFGHK